MAVTDDEWQQLVEFVQDSETAFLAMAVIAIALRWLQTFTDGKRLIVLAMALSGFLGDGLTF